MKSLGPPNSNEQELSALCTMLDTPGAQVLQQLDSERVHFVVSNLSAKGQPLVYVSDAFMALTGYKLDQIMGRNCNFLQGPDTDPATVKRIAIQISEEREVCHPSCIC